MNPAPPSISELTLAATPNAVAWARRHTVDVLQRWRFPAEGIEIARLLVSELATNAIQHARPAAPSATTITESAGPGTIVLRLWPTDGGVVISVGDSDPRSPVPRTGDSSATGGRGLLLTQAMANRWGYYQPGPQSGKIVWAEIPANHSTSLGEPGSGKPPSIGRLPRPRPRDPRSQPSAGTSRDPWAIYTEPHRDADPVAGPGADRRGKTLWILLDISRLRGWPRPVARLAPHAG
ncbi:ATP-binding protein [Streptomyces sp. NPDC102424]|uniref:ATP-binding protein n=1 Tax=Streptomyces sp. NPDC102424 TaxID=3366174 RepID=UPI00381B63DD